MNYYFKATSNFKHCHLSKFMDQFCGTIEKTIFLASTASIINCNSYVVNYNKQKIKKMRLINVQCQFIQIVFNAKMFMRQHTKNLKQSTNEPHNKILIFSWTQNNKLHSSKLQSKDNRFAEAKKVIIYVKDTQSMLNVSGAEKVNIVASISHRKSIHIILVITFTTFKTHLKNFDLHNANHPSTFKQDRNSTIVIFYLTSGPILIHWLVFSLQFAITSCFKPPFDNLPL